MRLSYRDSRIPWPGTADFSPFASLPSPSQAPSTSFPAPDVRQLPMFQPWQRGEPPDSLRPSARVLRPNGVSPLCRGSNRSFSVATIGCSCENRPLVPSLLPFGSPEERFSNETMWQSHSVRQRGLSRTDCFGIAFLYATGPFSERMMVAGLERIAVALK